MGYSMHCVTPVFDNPRASDPSHSLLSKNHFGLILNELAGKITILVVEHSVKLIVQAWPDNCDPWQAVNVILEAFHLPYCVTSRLSIQDSMFEELVLTKESVRNGKNKLGSENKDLSEPGQEDIPKVLAGTTMNIPATTSIPESQSMWRVMVRARWKSMAGLAVMRAQRATARQKSTVGLAAMTIDQYGSSHCNEETEGYKFRHHRNEDNEDLYGSCTQCDESSDGYTLSYLQPEEHYGSRTKSSEAMYDGEERSQAQSRSRYGWNEESEVNEYGRGECVSLYPQKEHTDFFIAHFEDA
ncbi:heterokaryon incompatibility protein Het-C-domain-containing protein [Mycena albidolilacea]|uniref:Heterokaryon incompatibility protein Het-C-domain-containing protein n=1 Tax=Mycena albidolilacea TaxID=1033008 RepID=A0AAD7EKU5_9AGAR|nr:heterokaryon incompatibility protein Het-C-domain-containing protein [Mycena albidolilacea]